MQSLEALRTKTLQKTTQSTKHNTTLPNSQRVTFKSTPVLEKNHSYLKNKQYPNSSQTMKTNNDCSTMNTLRLTFRSMNTVASSRLAADQT